MLPVCALSTLPGRLPSPARGRGGGQGLGSLSEKTLRSRPKHPRVMEHARPAHAGPRLQPIEGVLSSLSGMRREQERVDACPEDLHLGCVVPCLAGVPALDMAAPSTSCTGAASQRGWPVSQAYAAWPRAFGVAELPSQVQSQRLFLEVGKDDSTSGSWVLWRKPCLQRYTVSQDVKLQLGKAHFLAAAWGFGGSCSGKSPGVQGGRDRYGVSRGRGGRRKRWGNGTRVN